jgi:hypothetical protein
LGSGPALRDAALAPPGSARLVVCLIGRRRGGLEFTVHLVEEILRPRRMLRAESQD